MGQSTEDIEAKLAAFVDGELDAAGIEEIERHLQSNPQHRTLLDDLMRGRALLKDLPREGAPPEILESIQSHLERRLLLDEESANVAGRIGPNRMRQFMAVAAVLLLTATLGLMIYSALPSPKTGGELTAVLPKDEPLSADIPTPIREMSVPAPPASSSDLRDRAAVAVADSIRAGEPAVPTGEPLASARSAEPRGAEPSLPHPSAPGSAISLPGSAVATLDAGQSPVLMLVSDDPKETEKQVSGLLQDKGVKFEQLASTATPQATRVADAGQIASNAGESIFLAKKLTRAQYQALNEQLQMPGRARQQPLSAEAQRVYQAAGGNLASARDLATKSAADAFDVSMRGGKEERDKDGARLDTAAAKPYGGGFAPAPVETKANETSNTAIDQARRIESEAAASQPAVLASGDRLKVTIPQMMQSNIGGAQSVEVAPDGTIQIPSLEPVQVAGLSIDQAKQKLSSMMTFDKNGPVGELTVEKEAEPLTDVVIVVRSAIINENASGFGAATQPAAAGATPTPAPTTAPAEAPAAAPATTAPSTQPG